MTQMTEECVKDGLAPSSAFQNQLDGRNMVSGADNNAEGTPLLVFEVDSAAATVSNIVSTHGIRFIDAVFHKNGAGGGGETGRVSESANVITNAKDLNLADNAAARLTTAVDTIDDAQHELAAGETLRLTTVGAATSAADMFAMAIRT